MKRFIITKTDEGQRLNRFLEKTVPGLYASLMYKYLRTKKIKVNGKRAEASFRLAEGDIVELYIPDDLLDAAKKQADFMRAQPALTVIYEDENIALLYKPAGVLSHDDENADADTLVNRFLRYLYNRGAYVPNDGESFVPALCNRLDRGTAGIVIAAKNRAALAEMNRIIKGRHIHKSYLAAVIAPPPKDSTYIAYLKKDSKNNLVQVYDSPAGGAKRIVTGIRMLKHNDGLYLLEIDHVTGRTHQIRAHLRHLGCPILGDGKYGDGRVNRAFGIKRQALAAYKIGFDFNGEAFETLDYLDGRSFQLDSVWFAEEYF